MSESYLFVAYPKCTTCQRAQKWLEDNGISYQLRNIKEDRPTVAELKKWHKAATVPLKKFFNTSGLVYKSLALKEKLPAMGEEEQFSLLATDGMLVKRPLLITGSNVLIGFKEAEWALLKGSKE